MKDFLELADKRQSWRRYTDAPVEKEKLLACVKSAILGPSGCNSQPWKFIVLNNKEKCADFAEKCLQCGGVNKFTSKAAAFIVIAETKATLMPGVAEAFGGDNQHFGKIDVGIACAHITLAAEDLGLGTCILGWIDIEATKEYFGLTDCVDVPIVISVGYPEGERRTKKRKDFDDICEYID